MCFASPPEFLWASRIYIMMNQNNYPQNSPPSINNIFWPFGISSTTPGETAWPRRSNASISPCSKNFIAGGTTWGIFASWPIGPRRRRPFGSIHRKNPFTPEQAKTAGGSRLAGRRSGDDSRRRRAGHAAGLRSSQGHVRHRPRFAADAVSNSRRKDRRRLAALRRENSALPDDQSRHARGDGRVLQGA